MGFGVSADSPGRVPSFSGRSRRGTPTTTGHKADRLPRVVSTPVVMPTATVTFLLTDIEESSRYWKANSSACSGAQRPCKVYCHDDGTKGGVVQGSVRR
jgi:hypothetical protein